MIPPRDCKAFCPFAVFVSRELPSEAQQVQTQLHRSCSEDFYTYHNVPWKIFIRKEVQIMGALGDRLVSRSYRDKGVFTKPWSLSWQVFYPKDSINNPLLLDLIFRQVRHRAGPAAPQGPLGEGVFPSGAMVYSSHCGHPAFPAELPWKSWGCCKLGLKGTLLLPTQPHCSSPPFPDLQRCAVRHLHPDQPGGAAPLEIPLW